MSFSGSRAIRTMCHKYCGFFPLSLSHSLSQGTLLLKLHSLPNAHKTLETAINALELFSCNLDNEDESALSILDPVDITLEIKPPRDEQSPGSLTRGVSTDVDGTSAKTQMEEDKGTMQTLEVLACTCMCYIADCLAQL